MKSTLFTLFILLLIVSNMHAQTIEQLAKENAPKVCACLAQIEYIDSRAVFELKLDACIEQTYRNTTLLKDKDSLKKYDQLIQSELMDCATIETLIENLRESLWQEASEPTPDSLGTPDPQGAKITGQYDLRFGDRSPLGMAILTIFTNGTYQILSFGEVRVGRWKIVKEKYLHLIPAKHKHPFQIYGRHNSALGDSTKTAFLGDDFSYSTLIKYGPTQEDSPTFAPIFNIDANCFNFPNTYMNPGKFNQISLVYKQLPKENYLYTFHNKQHFNDFIIFETTKTLNERPTRVIIGEDELIFRKNKITQRRNITKEVGGPDYFKEFTEVPNSVYFNSGYKHFEEETILSKSYKFNKEQNTFIYNSDIEYPTDNAYDNFSQINKYERLKDISTEKKIIKTGEKSIIYTVCD